MARHHLPPRRMELANVRVNKSVNISQEKLVSRVVQAGKCHTHSVHVHLKNPNKNIQSDRELPFKLPFKKACLAYSPPSSALVMGSSSLRSPIVDIHTVKIRLGTKIPRTHESDEPNSSLYAHSFSLQPTCSGYLQWTALPLSFSPSSPRRPPLVGHHYLVTPHL